MDPTVECDLYRHAGKANFRTLLSWLLHSPGFKFTFVFRMGSKQRTFSPAFLFYKLLHRRYYYKYGFQIPLKTRIGKGLYIAHFGNIVVHNEAVVGENCNLAHGVTIGQTNRGTRKGVPCIGNRVWIGAGAVLVGRITVGDNVLIAPNSYVNFDVPSNSIVVGNPARVIPKDHATDGYINSVMPSLLQDPARAE